MLVSWCCSYYKNNKVALSTAEQQNTISSTAMIRSIQLVYERIQNVDLHSVKIEDLVDDDCPIVASVNDIDGVIAGHLREMVVIKQNNKEQVELRDQAVSDLRCVREYLTIAAGILRTVRAKHGKAAARPPVTDLVLPLEVAFTKALQGFARLYRRAARSTKRLYELYKRGEIGEMEQNLVTGLADAANKADSDLNEATAVLALKEPSRAGPVVMIAIDRYHLLHEITENVAPQFHQQLAETIEPWKRVAISGCGVLVATTAIAISVALSPALVAASAEQKSRPLKTESEAK